MPYKDPNKNKEAKRLSYLKHRDAAYKRKKQSRKQNPEKLALDGAKWRMARRFNRKSGNKMPSPSVIFEIYEHQLYYADECIYCGNPSTCLDHFYPLSKGGKNCLFNMVAACSKCNSIKKDKIFLTIIEAQRYINDSYEG
jgi:5-methylcytosine-specific restriction endonuclease McrA